MDIPREKFENWVSEALGNLPERFKERLYNLAVLIEDYPSAAQLKKLNLRPGDSLFGLFEGFSQSRRLNFGPVLPDRITIFRRAIADNFTKEEEVKKEVFRTVKHEIAHHFGSDEPGARKATR